MCLRTDSWLFEEEQLFGCLNVTIHRVVGLKQPASVYICVELDSFKHFFLKAKTETIFKSKEPVWNMVSQEPVWNMVSQDRRLLKSFRAVLHFQMHFVLEILHTWRTGQFDCVNTVLNVHKF